MVVIIQKVVQYPAGVCNQAPSEGFRLTHFLRVLCLCGDAGPPPLPGCCLQGWAAELDTSWWFAETDMRLSRGFPAISAEADSPQGFFHFLQSIWIGRMEACSPWLKMFVSSTNCSGKSSKEQIVWGLLYIQDILKVCAHVSISTEDHYVQASVDFKRPLWVAVPPRPLKTQPSVSASLCITVR